MDSIVTDPPYGFAFMGKKWDYEIPSVEMWKEALRVLKPGGHLLAFGGPRTYHRLACNIEDAGFEIRDQLQWLFGSGFPKSLNVAKQIGNQYECRLLKVAKPVENQSGLFQVELPEGKTVFVLVNAPIHQGDEQEKITVIGAAVVSSAPTGTLLFESTETIDSSTLSLWSEKLNAVSQDGKTSITLTELETITGLKIWNCLRSPNTLENMQSSDGLGTALKPANEPILLARKPLSESTVAKNVLRWGTGGLNIDASRIGYQSESVDFSRIQDGNIYGGNGIYGKAKQKKTTALYKPTGRFPANLILDEVAAEMLDEQSGELKSGNLNTGHRRGSGVSSYDGGGGIIQRNYGGDIGGASRFFYCAKTSKRERNAGLEGTVNTHPTLKPIRLMRYLCKLITPPNGIILDPFMGSGSTGCAAIKDSFDFIGIEREPEYMEIARRRIEHAKVVEST